MQQVAPGLRLGGVLHVFNRALRHQTPAAFAGARSNVDDVVGRADGVFVVLHHHQRVALVAQGFERAQQDFVVARMQADGGLIQHVANALQIAAQLRGQPNALRLAATQRRRAAVQRQIAQAHFFQKFEAAFDLGNQVAGNVALALAQGARALQSLHPGAHVAYAQGRNVGNAHAVKAHRARGRVQARAVAARASGIRQVFDVGLGKGLLAALVVVVFD